MIGQALLYWSNISFTLDGSVGLLLFLILVALLFSLYLYSQTTPVVSRFLRLFLFCLRSLAFIVLLTLLFHPVLSLHRNFTQKPDIAVLIDKSGSLQIVDASHPRSEIVENMLKNSFWTELQHNFNLHFELFSDEVDTTFSLTLLDSLHFDGAGTDIAKALEVSKNRLLDQFYCAAIIISDGIYNVGENPEFLAQRYGVPIYTIGVGDAREKKDVILARVVSNDVVYVNNRVPVDISLSQVGFTGERVQVFLKQGSEVLDQQMITLAADNQEQHLQLFYTAIKTGFQKYQVEIPGLAGEFTLRNNHRSFVVKVLESKIQILLLAGEPSTDYKFITRALQSDENIQLTTLVQRSDNGFYYRPPLDKILNSSPQVIVFLDFPRESLPPAVNQFLNENLIQKKAALFFIQGSEVNIAALRNFANILPFDLRPIPSSPREVTVAPVLYGEELPLVMLTDDRLQNQKIWSDLPPVVTYLNNYTPFPDARVLLQIQPGQSNLPLADNYRKPILLARNLGEQKSLAFLAHGLWRWDLMMWGVGKTNDALLTFLQRAIRWLITREELRRVRIITDKFIYRSGEQVFFQAQVYTDDYQPVEDAEVDVRMTRQKDQYPLRLEPTGNGKYQAQFRIFQGGDYEFKGEAKRGDQFFGADSGKFSVGEHDIEFQQTRMNEPLLQKMAQLSGGVYYTPANFQQLANQLPTEKRQRQRVSDINLWNEWLVLALFLVLLALEWTIRRRRGML